MDITFQFDVQPASPSRMLDAEDWLSLLALPSPSKFDPPLLSPLDMAKIGPPPLEGFLSPLVMFFGGETDVIIHPTSPRLVDSCPINSYPVNCQPVSPLCDTEGSNLSSRSVTPRSTHSESELPSSYGSPTPSLSSSSSPSPSPSRSSYSESSPCNSRSVTSHSNTPPAPKATRTGTSVSHSPSSSGSRSIISTSSSKTWSEAENKVCMKLMRQVCSEPKFQGKESRFVEVGRRMLSEYGFRRPNVKNQWNRYLRARCGFEDRGEKKRGGGVITSALGRKRKRGVVDESDDDEESVDDDEEDEEENNDRNNIDAEDGYNLEDSQSNADTGVNAEARVKGINWRPIGGKSYGGKSIPGYIPSYPYGDKSLPSKKILNTRSLSIDTNNHNYTGGKSIRISIEREEDYITEPICGPSSPSTSTETDDEEEEDEEDDGDASEHDSLSPEPAPKRTKIADRDATMAAELQRAWGLGLRRRRYILFQ